MTKLITTKQLAAATAGGDNAIRTKKGQVVGLALRLDMNPDAPYVIIVRKGVQRERRAQLATIQDCHVPTYIKRDTDAWEYIGDYGPYVFKTDVSTIQKLAKHRKPNSVAGGLFLDESSRIKNRGFPDAATRKAVEKAAVEFVMLELREDGYKVEDHQKDNLGYDLLATKEGGSLRVEVKGTDAPLPRFFLSRNEYRCALLHADWQLKIVCEARTKPRVLTLSGSDLEKTFNLDPKIWECTPK